jgi:hypothetical protein
LAGHLQIDAIRIRNFLDRYHADADPDPTFQFDADLLPDPDLDPDPTPRFTHVGISKTFSLRLPIHSSASLQFLIFLVSFIGVIIFNICERILKYFWKKV